MKNKTAILQTGLLLLLILACSQSVFAKGTPIGDIMLRGRVERAGQKLLNNSTLFAGDTIRTHDGIGSVRIGRGRLEIGVLSEVEIVSEQPLQIVLKSGRLDFSFPVGTDFEIVTPQLVISPTMSPDSYSGFITATPAKEDRVTSRKGRYSILELEEGGETNAIHEGQVLVAALVMPALPQGAGRTIARIVRFDPPDTTQVDVARAARPKNFSTRASVPMDLFNGDVVRAVRGNARIVFTSDDSTITLRPGTDAKIEEVMEPAGLLRTISQTAGSLWFLITKNTGTRTKLDTPTAVAAIRGTEGQNDVDLAIANSTTFALTEGEEDLEEKLTGSKLTLRTGQTVTAIRGVGFGVVTALTAIIGPSVGSATPGAGGVGGAGGTGGAGGAAAGATASAATATTSTVSAVVSTVASVGAVVGGTTALAITEDDTPASPTQPPPDNTPLSPPGV